MTTTASLSFEEQQKIIDDKLSYLTNRIKTVDALYHDLKKNIDTIDNKQLQNIEKYIKSHNGIGKKLTYYSQNYDLKLSEIKESFNEIYILEKKFQKDKNRYKKIVNVFDYKKISEIESYISSHQGINDDLTYYSKNYDLKLNEIKSSYKLINSIVNKFERKKHHYEKIVEDEISKIQNNYSLNVKEKNKKLSSEFIKHESDINTAIDNINEKFTKIHNDNYEKLDNFSIQLTKKMDSVKEQYLSEVDRKSSLLNDVFKNYENDIEERSKNIEKTFLAKLKTEAAITFWGDKASTHSRNEVIIILLISLFSIISIGLLLYLISIFHEKGIDFSNVKLWTVVSMGGFSFFTIWVGRFLIRLYFIQNNLKEEASGKLVIAQTYISLVKDNLVSDSQVDIILQSLFSSKDNMISFKNETSPVLPQEALLKIIQTGVSNSTSK